MENKIVLVITRSKDYWYNNKITSYKVNPWVIHLRELWNSFFNYKIIDFCNDLRDISSSNYLKNKFDEILLYSEIDPKYNDLWLLDKKIIDYHKDSILIPLDEDDWIDPSLASILRGIETDKTFFVWNYYKTIRGYEFEPFKNNERGRGWTIPSSWAVRGFDNFIHRDGHLKIKENEFNDIYFIRNPLGVKVEHAGSLGFLTKTVRKNWGKEEEWMNVIISKIRGDLTVEGNEYPEVFQDQFKKYKELLQKLLKSKKKNI